MKKTRKNPWIKFCAALMGAAALFLLFRLAGIDFSQFTVETLQAEIRSYGIWGPVAYIVFYLLRPLVLFPAGVLSAAAGIIWGLKGLAFLLIAAYISAVAEFVFARYFAREAVEQLVKGKMANIDKAIERRGFLTVLLIRLIPNVAWDIQNLGLGITKVRFRDYFLATVIGIIPGSFVLVYLGSSFISVVTNPDHVWKLLVAVGLLGALVFLQYLWRKKRPRKINEMAG